MKNYVFKKFKNKDYQITVEEVNNMDLVNSFIVVFKNKKLKSKSVYEFETYGGACDVAFDLLVDILNESPYIKGSIK